MGFCTAVYCGIKIFYSASCQRRTTLTELPLFHAKSRTWNIFTFYRSCALRPHKHFFPGLRTISLEWSSLQMIKICTIWVSRSNNREKSLAASRWSSPHVCLQETAFSGPNYWLLIEQCISDWWVFTVGERTIQSHSFKKICIYINKYVLRPLHMCLNESWS